MPYQRIAKPFAGKTIKISSREIDARDVDRVITLTPGITVLLDKCKIKNANSIIEGACREAHIAMTGCDFQVTKRHSLYLESRKADRSPIYTPSCNVILEKCIIRSSRYETPIRTMFGVNLIMTDCTVIDTADDDANKDHQALRAHGRNVILKRCNIVGRTMIGAETRIVNQRQMMMQSATADACNFADGITICDVTSAVVKGGSISTGFSQTGWAISYKPSDNARTVHLIGVDVHGKIDGRVTMDGSTRITDHSR